MQELVPREDSNFTPLHLQSFLVPDILLVLEALVSIHYIIETAIDERERNTINHEAGASPEEGQTSAGSPRIISNFRLFGVQVPLGNDANSGAFCCQRFVFRKCCCSCGLST